MIIRPASIPQLEEIIAIYNQAIQSGHATGDTELQKASDKLTWFTNHQNEKYPLLVAEHEDVVLGWLSLSPYREGRGAFRFTAEVSYYIHCDFHRQGIATALMHEAENHCKRKGIKTWVAFLLAHNISSIGLLKKFGFTLWGTLPAVADIKNTEYDHVFYGKRLLK